MVRQRKPRKLAVFLLLCVVAVWGGTFALVKDALSDVSPLLFNFLRMLVASVALVLVNWRSMRGLRRETLLAGGVVGLFLAAGYQLQTAGLALTSASNSAFITGLVVVFVPMFSLLPGLRSARVPAPRLVNAVGAALAFSGFHLMTTNGAMGVASLLRSIRIGDVLTLGCAIAFAAHLLSLSHFADVPLGQLATLQVAAATIVMALTMPLGGPAHIQITARLLVALLVTGLFATAFAFTVQSWAQQHLPASTAALLLTLEPVVALIVSVALLHERLVTRSLFGAALILGGILVTETARQRSVLPPEPI